MGCSSCHQPPPEWALHSLQLPSGYIYLLQYAAVHSLQGEDLLHCNPPTGCRGQFASPWSSLQGYRGTSALAPKAVPCPSFTHLGALQGCFSHIFFTPYPHRCNTAIFTINMLSQISTHMVDGPSFGQCWAHFRAGWISVLYGGATPLTPSHRDQRFPPKPCLVNQMQQLSHRPSTRK